MTRNTRRGTLVAATAALLTGCLRAPEVDLTGVRVGGIGFGGATLIAELEIRNLNRFSIETDSVTFQLDAQDAGSRGTWTQVTAGTNPQRFRIEKQDTTAVEIPIEFAYARLSTPIRSLMQSGRFNYRVSGQVFIRRPLPKRVPFSETGTISLFSDNQ